MHRAGSISARLDGSGTSALMTKVSPAARPRVSSSQSAWPFTSSGLPKWNSAHSGDAKLMLALLAL